MAVIYWAFTKCQVLVRELTPHYVIQCKQKHSINTETKDQWKMMLIVQGKQWMVLELLSPSSLQSKHFLSITLSS